MGNFTGLQAKYSEAAEAAPPGAKELAVYFANRAACQLKLQQWGPAAADCTRALEVDPAYLKALLRRCTAYEELDDLEKALTDAKKVCGRWHLSAQPCPRRCITWLKIGRTTTLPGCLDFIWPVCADIGIGSRQRGDVSKGPPSRAHRCRATREDEGRDDGCVLHCYDGLTSLRSAHAYFHHPRLLFGRQAQGAGQHRAGQVRDVAGQLQS